MSYEYEDEYDDQLAECDCFEYNCEGYGSHHNDCRCNYDETECQQLDKR